MKSKPKIQNRTKKIIYIISFSLLTILFCCLLFFTRDSKKIIEITDFIKTDIKVLYVTNNNELKYPVEILDKYDVDYLKINSADLTIFERKKLKKIIDNDSLSNILVIYDSGKIIDTLVEYSETESVDDFLQENNIIPEKIVPNVDDIMSRVESILDSSYSMVYIPYKELEIIDDQDKIFEEISDKYLIDYKRIDAYLLSNNQQEKINSLLGLSLVEDQILILIKDNKMIANIRGIHRKNTYIENLYDVNFIDELENKVNDIDYDEFELELSNKEKSIILIGSDTLKDSNDVLSLLNQMIYSYDIIVNYINIKKDDSDTYNKVKEKLENINYTGGFSLPLVIIVESNDILDYAIGNSKEEYFIDIFIENGVIKGDVINE